MLAQLLPAGALPFTNVDVYIADLHCQELALRQLRQPLQRFLGKQTNARRGLLQVF